MESAIVRDGPGAMAFGDTVTVKGIFENHESSGNVTFDVFGSHVQIGVWISEREYGSDAVNCKIDHCDRSLGEDQKEYIMRLSKFLVGASLGWFEHDSCPKHF